MESIIYNILCKIEKKTITFTHFATFAKIGDIN